MNYRIYLLALVAFMSGFDENLMIGMLSPVAQSLDVSVAAAGQLTSIFSLTFGLSAPILIVLCANWERRKLLLVALATYFVANLMGGLAPNYSLLFIARILQAASCALICMLATTIATRLVPDAYRGRALGTVVMGISASLVLGIPAGIWIGSWRLAFVLVALTALVLLVIALYALPRLEPTGALPLKAYANYCRRPTLLFAQLVTILVMGSYFALFGYLTPYLGERFHLNAEQIALSYMVLGVIGIFGSYLGGLLADSLGPKRAFWVVPGLFFLSSLAVACAGDSAWALALGLSVWTLIVWGIGPVVQNYLILRDPGRIDVSIGFNISAIQLGIALGAACGGLVTKQLGLFQTPMFAALMALIALICVLISLYTGRTPGTPSAVSEFA